MSRYSFEWLSIKGWGAGSRSDLPLAWVMDHKSWDRDWIRMDLPMPQLGAGQGLTIHIEILVDVAQYYRDEIGVLFFFANL